MGYQTGNTATGMADAMPGAGLLQHWLAQARTWTVTEGPDWALGLAAVFGIYLVFRIIRVSLAGLIGSSNAPVNSFRNVLAGLISGTNSLFIITAAATAIAPFLFPVSADAANVLQTIFTIVLIFQIAIWAKVLTNAVLSRIADNHSADESTLANAMSLISLFANVIIFSIALIMVLNNLGVNVTGLVAGLGVGGIAVALAAQNIFRDLFASLSIVLDRPFLRGDFIRFGEIYGEVDKIGLKTTRLRSLTGEQIVIGNAQLLDKEIFNYRRMERRRLGFDVGVIYQTPHAKLQAIPGWLEDICGQIGMVEFDRSHLKTFGESAIVFETVVWITSREYRDFMDARQQVMLGIHRKFEQEGIDFAYPTRMMYIEEVGGTA